MTKFIWPDLGGQKSNLQAHKSSNGDPTVSLSLICRQRPCYCIAWSKIFNRRAKKTKMKGESTDKFQPISEVPTMTFQPISEVPTMTY